MHLQQRTQHGQQEDLKAIAQQENYGIVAARKHNEKSHTAGVLQRVAISSSEGTGKTRNERQRGSTVC